MKDTIRFIGNLVFIVSLIVILFVYAMFQGGFVSWFLFYSFLPILLYQLLFVIYPIKNWKLSRTFSHSIAQAGDDIQVVLKLERSTAFPIFYCIVEDIFPETLKKLDTRHHKYYHLSYPGKLVVTRTVKKIIFVGFQRKVEIPYTIAQTPRGKHDLRTIRIKTSDFFGFIKKEHSFEVEDQLYIYPNEREVALTKKASSFEQGKAATNVFHLVNTNVATGVREYAPGDRFSWIDWKQTAKNNTVMTKEFEQEKSSELLFVLDSCHFKGMNALAYEASIELCYSLVRNLERQETDVGLLTVAEEPVYFPLHHDSFTKQRIGEHLMKIQPTGSSPFSMKLKENMQMLERADMIILLTTHLDDFMKQTIQHLRQRTRNIHLFFIHSSASISKNETKILHQFKSEGLSIQEFTENELVVSPLEVNLK